MTLLYLGLAIIFEIGWAIALKASLGFTRPRATAITLVCYALSLVFLMLVTRRMDIGVAYAIWAGMGAAGIALLGIIFFNEPMTLLRGLSLLLVIAGVIGLNLADRASGAAL